MKLKLCRAAWVFVASTVIVVGFFHVGPMRINNELKVALVKRMFSGPAKKSWDCANYTTSAFSPSTPISNGIHIVWTWPLLKNGSYHGNGYNAYNLEQIKKRHEEYVSTLCQNIVHPMVTKIFFLSENPELQRKTLMDIDNLDTSKIVILGSSSKPSYKEFMEFISDNLQEKLVFVLNADAIIGKGFDELDLKWWHSGRKEMYALTDHLPLTGCKTGSQSHCGEHGQYIGSHNGFLFSLKKPAPLAFLNVLDFSSYQFGSENVVIWAFQNLLQYNVTNPCKRLFIHHNHCSNLTPTRNRVNTPHNTGLARFSF